MKLMYKGTMDIFKHKGQDFSNGGLSSRFDTVNLVENVNRNNADELADNDVVLLHDICCGKPRIRAVPAKLYLQDKWYMFGGSFVHTSNGVVTSYHDAIPLHDRVE